MTWRPGVGEYMEVPCGYCVGCRIDRSRSWAIRCTNESQMFEENAFITLTYAPEHLPTDGSLNKRDFQNFMKRLRKEFAPFKLRYFHCGEYGEQLKRPHHHAIIFGTEFPDRYLSAIRNEHRLYRSPTLERLWPFGHSEIGDVTFQSAGYVARYIQKKIVGDQSLDHYTDQETGIILEPEYTTMSRRPGIGKTWFQKYWRDVYPHDYVVINGTKYKPPRYYDKLYEEMNPDDFKRIQTIREQKAKESPDNTPQRLATRKFCKEQQLKKLPRNLEGNNP